MRIRAIGIFENNGKHGYQVKHALDDKNLLTNFRRNVVTRFLKQSPRDGNRYADDVYNRTYHTGFKDLHFYYQLNSNTHHILVMATETRLGEAEAQILFGNINYIDQSANELKQEEGDADGLRMIDMKNVYVETRLQDILTSKLVDRSRPVRFNTAKIDKIRQDGIDPLMEVMRDNIEKVLERGEKIEDLQVQSELLAQQSRLFLHGAEDLRIKTEHSCCPGVYLAAAKAKRGVGMG